METPPAAPRRWTRKLLIAAVIAPALLVLLYTLGGFVLLPWYAQRELPRLIDQQLHRHASVGEIKFNPFSLTLDIADFALKEKDGRPLVAFKHASVDVEWRSLAKRAVVFGEIILDAPAVEIDISPEGRLNLAALAGDQSAAPKEPAASASPRFVIGDLQISRGTIGFDDRRVGYKNRFEDLAFKLSSLSTFADDKGPYALSARTPGGATLKWKGELSLAPLVASGTIALEHGALPELQPFIKEFLNASITSGRASVELPYHFALPDGKPHIVVKSGKLSIEQFALTATGADAPLLKFETFTVDDIALDLANRNAEIGALRIDGVDIKARRDENGVIDLTKLLVPHDQDKPSAPWRVALASAELANGAIAFDDRKLGLAPALKNIAIKLADVTGDFAKPVGFDVAATIASGGTLSTRGKFSPGGSIDAQINIATVALTPLQPLIAHYANAVLASGEASLAGTLKSGKKAGTLIYSGGAGITNLQINDPTGVPLVGWKSLATTTLRAQTTPLQIQIDALHWDAPSVKYAIATDKTTNVQRAIKKNAAIVAAAEAAPATPATTTAPPPPADAVAASAPAADGDDDGSGIVMAIRRINIKGGVLDFSDDSLAGGFATSVHELDGTLNGISSDRSTRSQLALEGRVDQYGYAKISGSLNPFIPRDRSNARLEFRNLDVTRVTPYVVRFAGYKVASGRLSLDLNYRVRNNLIDGDNKILLEQFTLGEKVDYPGALDLPLNLAIALLKDSDGKIDLALPVSGNLDDPKFDYGQIIHKAIVNLITGIITAPFRLLGRLFSRDHGEEAGQIAFEPGSSRLLPPEREKIQHVVEALGKRPELKLQVPARYDSAIDARALKRAALRRELGKRANLDIAEEDPPGPLNIEDRRTRAAIRDLFAERFGSAELDKLRTEAEAKDKSRANDDGKAPASLSLVEKLGRFASGEPHVADTGEFYRALGSRLVAAQPLPPEALTELARKRASAIADSLKAAGIDAARVQLTTAEPVNKADAKTVSVDLGLSGI